MQLKRYTTEELQQICKDLFYDYMSKEDNDSEFITPAHKVYSDYKEIYNTYATRISQFSQLLNSPEINAGAREALEQEISYLRQGMSYLENSNLKFQKYLYEKTGVTDFSRSSVRIPLNKEINSYYDDFVLEVLFYDDVCTLNSKFSEYEKLRTNQERRDFLEQNTEITNMALGWVPNRTLKALITLEGDLNIGNPRVEGTGVALLSKKFSDFENLTLKDTSEIDNNDLKQFLQSKIDMDKENMVLMSDQIIRGDEYKILQSPIGGILYIRYVCRSTGRVYYDELNLGNLKLSEYYKDYDYDSYAKAWWNLTHLGSKVDGKPIVAC